MIDRPHPGKRADALELGDVIFIGGWPADIREIVKKRFSVIVSFSDDPEDWTWWAPDDIVPVVAHVAQDAAKYV